MFISMMVFMGVSFASPVESSDKKEYQKLAKKSFGSFVEVSADKEYGLSLIGKGYTNKTMIIHLRRYGSFGNYLHSLGYLSYNPGDKLEPDKDIGSINFITPIRFDC
jgi:hypothetical protein